MLQLKCPNCSREFVRRVPRVGLMELMEGWFCIYPFKCQICGFRFRFFQWGVRYLRADEDHRQYDRMALNFPVAFRVDQFEGAGNVLNISMAGCSFTTASKLAMGAIMRLELRISNDAAPVIVEAAVLRHWRNQVAGVEFIQWQQSERERLQLFVHGLLIGRSS
jgi:PilZ domain-containing protein